MAFMVMVVIIVIVVIMDIVILYSLLWGLSTLTDYTILYEHVITQQIEYQIY
jgi:hypothetical protein